MLTRLLRQRAFAWFGFGAIFLVLGIWEWLSPPLSVTVWNPFFMRVYASYGVRAPALLYLLLGTIQFVLGAVKSERSSSVAVFVIMCAAALIGFRLPLAPPVDRMTSKAVESMGLQTSKTVCGGYVEAIYRGVYDAPVWYLRYPDRELVMVCGGACMGGPGRASSKQCTACPPPEWVACKDPAAERARLEAAAESATRAAIAVAQQEAAQRTADEKILRENKGDGLFEPVTLGSLYPELAREFHIVQADEEFVNVHTVFVDRLAIDAPVTVFSVDGKTYRFVGTLRIGRGMVMDAFKGQTLSGDRWQLASFSGNLGNPGSVIDAWQGRTLSGDRAWISRAADSMEGKIFVDGRQFWFRSHGDFGFVYEADPRQVAERQANSRLPQEMARARFAKEQADRTKPRWWRSATSCVSKGRS